MPILLSVCLSLSLSLSHFIPLSLSLSLTLSLSLSLFLSLSPFISLSLSLSLSFISLSLSLLFISLSLSLSQYVTHFFVIVLVKESLKCLASQTKICGVHTRTYERRVCYLQVVSPFFFSLSLPLSLLLYLMYHRHTPHSSGHHRLLRFKIRCIFFWREKRAHGLAL